jgi:hypothetical protein
MRSIIYIFDIFYSKTSISSITIQIIFAKILFAHIKIILHSSSNCTIHRWTHFLLLTRSALTSSIEKQQINRQSIRIFKTSTIRLTINVTINVSRIDNIIVNSSTIVTMIDFHLILVIVIDFRFAHLKFAWYVINLHVNQRIILKKNAKNRKSVLWIVIRHSKHVQNLNVVLNNLLSIMKIMT